MCDQQQQQQQHQQFVLRWHYHELTLLRNLPFLLESDVLTDVTLSVGTQNVRAHRLVLAMCSVYFLQLFQEMGNTQHPVIVLNNVGLDDIKAVLAFIYRGQCIVSKEQLPSLLSVAKLLKIQGLCDMKVPEKSLEMNSTQSPATPSKSTIEPDENIISNRERADICPSWPQSDANCFEFTPPFPRKPPRDASSETCKCFLCGKYLSNQYNLRVHMETHEEAYHACQSCPHVSRSRDALRKHVSYRHPDEYHTRKRKKTE